jgi:hypothetical protein
VTNSHGIHADRVPVSWRVRFAYQDDEIRPIAAEALRMIAPAGVGPSREEQGKLSGAYIEIRPAGANATRWSRTIAQPNRADREAFTEDGGIIRISARSEGEFELVIPDYGPDARFVLYTSPALEPEKPAKPRLRIRLAELSHLPAPPGHEPG